VETAAGLTVPQLLHRNAISYPNRPALSTYGVDGAITWLELRDRVAELSRGLAGLGLGPGDRMIMMMPSRVEHWLVDLAATHLGAVPCTAYATLSPSQLRYLGQHSAAKILVVNGLAELRKWQGVLVDLPHLRHVIVVDEDAVQPGTTSLATVVADGASAHSANPAAFDDQWQQVRFDQPVTLLYTSGTTGDPTGVLLSHHNVIYQSVVLEATVAVPDHPRTLAYLPLAHIAERVLGIYNLIYRAGHATIVSDPTQLVPALRAVRPNSFFGVPRVWEKMAAGVQAQLGNAEPHVTAAFDTASALARESYHARAEGKVFTEEQAARLAELDQAVLRPMRSMLGLDEMVWAGSGAAPIPVEVLLFLAGHRRRRRRPGLQGQVHRPWPDLDLTTQRQPGRAGACRALPPVRRPGTVGHRRRRAQGDAGSTGNPRLDQRRLHHRLGVVLPTQGSPRKGRRQRRPHPRRPARGGQVAHHRRFRRHAAGRRRKLRRWACHRAQGDRHQQTRQGCSDWHLRHRGTRRGQRQRRRSHPTSPAI
jgi:hypothetical protein